MSPDNNSVYGRKILETRQITVNYMVQAVVAPKTFSNLKGACEKLKFRCSFIDLTFNPFASKFSLVILLTFCHRIPLMLVWRIWYWIN